MIHTVFAEQARRTPSRVALRMGDRALTYAELDGRANHLARRLQPGTLVGVCLERSFEMVVAILGILKAGAAWVPLDPHYPPERLEYMLSETQGPVVTRPGLYAGKRATFLEEGLAEAPPEVPAELAYVFFTSGSTGRPKGVMGTHAATLNRFRWMWEAFPFGPDEVGVAKTSPNFVDSIWELLGPLLAGVPVVLASGAEAADAQALTDLLVRHRVTRLVVVPSLLSVLVDCWAGGSPLAPLLLTSSGEPLPSRLARRVLELPQDIRLLNLYGSSEVAADATWALVGKDDLDLPICSIGRPIANLTVELRPAEGVGEMWIGGAGLALGYYNRPELTAERFQDGLFKTGDLARRLPNGDLEYMGRVDFQVKIRGMRIEPGEIEAVARRVPGVDECVVVARDGKLVGYFTGSGEPLPALRSALPEYMVPSLMMRLEALPLNPNGKLDRAALPAPRWEQAAWVAPASPAERTLAPVWEKLLGVERVGVDDDFFALGGDSIQVLRLAIEARQAGLEVTPALVAQHPRLGELARAASEAAPLACEQGLAEGEGFPLTPMQHYYFSWATANPSWFNNAVLFKCARPLEVERLRQALEAMVRQHDGLRLRFTPAWTQRYSQDFLIPLEVLELGSDWLAQIREVCTRLQGSLDVVHGPAARAALFRGHPDGHDRLLLAMHHLTHDGTSMQFLFEDLEAAYEGRPLPRKSSSFARWCQALSEYARSAELARQWDYWLAVDGTPFPVDREADDATQADIAMHLEPLLSADELGSRRKGLVEALLESLLEVAHRRTGQRDLLLHRVGHGREACVQGVDVSRTAGWLVTHTPTLLRLGEPVPVLPDNGIGHGVLRWMAGDPRAQVLAKHDKVRTLFNFEGDLWEDAYYGELLGHGDPELLLLPAAVAPDNPADYYFYLVGLIQGGALNAELFYSRKHYEEATVRALAADLRGCVRARLLTAVLAGQRNTESTESHGERGDV